MYILIADDDPTGLTISRHMISRAGHSVETATDGGAALAALLAGRFDAALLDLQMPQMDGAAVAQGARAAMPPERRPRLIALTAAMPPGGQAAIEAMGFDAYLTKPLSLAALSAALEGAAAPPSAPLAPPPPTAPPGLAGPIIAAHAAGDTAALAAAAAALRADPDQSPALAALAARLERALAAADAEAVADLVRAIAEL